MANSNGKARRAMNLLNKLRLGPILFDGRVRVIAPDEFSRRWQLWVEPVVAELEELVPELRKARQAIAACEHERRNDHGDACLDCGAVFITGKWQ